MGQLLYGNVASSIGIEIRMSMEMLQLVNRNVAVM